MTVPWYLCQLNKKTSMMKAWVIDKISNLTREDRPLRQVELPQPEPGEGQLLIKISACGICHTEIDEIEGRTPPPVFPVVPGHQVVGFVEEPERSAGSLSGNSGFRRGDRVGVAWIYSSCGKCEYCLSNRENLCHEFLATGRDVNGGYAEYMVIQEKFAFPIPDLFTDAGAAPLLCAGAIGYRSVALCNLEEGQNIGLTGFGASAHLVLKLIKYKYPRSGVFIFARSPAEREFATELGAAWAGDTTEKSPVLLDCIIDTTPAWKPVVHALECLKPGGRLVINAIRKESADNRYLVNIDYSRHLWMEKEIKSVANVAASDVREFIRIAAEMPFYPEIETYGFDDANRAILEIKQRKIRGAKVLLIDK
jgi:alcohol dehydrogenase, propanol-preferring